jgi:hypothetical protein
MDTAAPGTGFPRSASLASGIVHGQRGIGEGVIILPHPRRKSPRVKAFAGFFSYRYESAPMTKFARMQTAKVASAHASIDQWSHCRAQGLQKKCKGNSLKENMARLCIYNRKIPDLIPPFGFRILASVMPVTSTDCTLLHPLNRQLSSPLLFAGLRSSVEFFPIASDSAIQRVSWSREHKEEWGRGGPMPVIMRGLRRFDQGGDCCAPALSRKSAIHTRAA